MVLLLGKFDGSAGNNATAGETLPKLILYSADQYSRTQSRFKSDRDHLLNPVSKRFSSGSVLVRVKKEIHPAVPE